MAKYQKDNRVRVIDPADRRKRVNGTVVSVNEGRGPLEYVVLLDDETVPMAFGPSEIVGSARVSQMTKAETEALAAIKAAGTLYPHNGVSITTVEALERKGLVAVTRRPPTRQYGTLGTQGGHGRMVANWSVTAA
jgi:hypothetical protein